jgi:hypothetical protein
MHVSSNFVASVIAIVSSVISNCGTNIQKKSHVQNNLLPLEKQTAYVTRKLWWLGMSGVIGGAIGDFLALGIGNQALVTGLGGGCTLIANVGFSHFWNGDQLFNSDVLGIFFVLCGAALFAIASPPANEYTVVQLKVFFQNDTFVLYMGVELLMIVCLLSAIASSSFYKCRVRLQRWFVKGGIRELEVRRHIGHLIVATSIVSPVVSSAVSVLLLMHPLHLILSRPLCPLSMN